MTNAKMHAIQVQDAPVFLKRTLAPGFELVGEGLVQAANCAGTGNDSKQGLCYFSHFVGTRPGDKHLGESFGNVRFIAAVAFKGLRVELTRAISGHVDLLEPTSGGHQIAGVVAIAVPFALGATLAPGRSNKLVELFTHHGFYHDPHRALGERTQVVMEDLLFWQYRRRWVGRCWFRRRCGTLFLGYRQSSLLS